MSSDVRQIIREAEALGWSVERGRRSKLTLRHPDAPRAVTVSGLGLGVRASWNLRAILRRSLRSAGGAR